MSWKTDEKVVISAYSSSASTTVFEWFADGVKIGGQSSATLEVFPKYPSAGYSLRAVAADGTEVSDAVEIRSAPPVIMVAEDGDDSNMGDSWANPKKSIAKAIEESSVAAREDRLGEVWVKGGTYASETSIEMKSYVNLRGGFSGTPSLASPAGSSADSQFREFVSTLVGTPFHPVLTASDVVSAEVEGFVVKGGRFGFYLENSKPTISSCLVCENSAGGIYAEYSDAEIDNCTISQNGGDGVAVYGIKKYSLNGVTTNNYSIDFYATIVNCTISANVGSAVKGTVRLCKNSILWNNAGGSTSIFPISETTPLKGSVGTFVYGGTLASSGGSMTYGSAIQTTSESDIPRFAVESCYVSCVIEGGHTTDKNIVDSDPLLGALADNGGFVPTMAVGDGSSAIGIGSLKKPYVLSDARGTLRRIPCTAGAYEYTAGTAFEKWAFDSGLRPSQMSPDKSPFADGISNLVRFAFGLPVDRTVNFSEIPHFDFSIKKSPSLRGADSGTETLQTYASMRYGVNSIALASGLKVSAYKSDNLVDWTEIPSIGDGADGFIEIFSFSESVPENGRLFFQVRSFQVADFFFSRIALNDSRCRRFHGTFRPDSCQNPQNIVEI